MEGYAMEPHLWYEVLSHWWDLNPILLVLLLESVHYQLKQTGSHKLLPLAKMVEKHGFVFIHFNLISSINIMKPGRVAQSVGHLTRKSGVLGSLPGLATYFRFSFRFFKKGSCQLLAKVCARSTG